MRERLLPALPRKHIQGLDGLRGIAVLGVVFYHLFPFTVKGGFLGVSFFFVLSGYLIAAISSAEWEKNIFHVLQFYLKRIKRIYPSLLIVIFVTAGFLRILASDVLNGIRQEVVSIIGGYNNLWQISQNASYFTKISSASPFTHLWSLSIELQFYLVWPVLFLSYQYLRKTKIKEYSRYLFVVLIFISFLVLEISFRPGEDVTPIYYGTMPRLFSLLMGAFMGINRKSTQNLKMSNRKRKKMACSFLLLLFVLILACLFIDGQGDFTYRVGLVASSLLFCMLLRLAVNANYPFGQWLDCKPLSWLGKHSYEIYLWQYPIIFIFQYKKWDNLMISPMLILILIGILSVWLQKIVNTISETIKSGGREMKHIKKAAFWMMTVFFSFSFVLGGCSMITAPDTKKEAEQQLQEELERNSQELQKQQIGTEPVENEVSLDSITAIGDSVMLGAAPAIKEVLPECVIDAKESRQVTQAKEVADILENQGNLGDTVIIALGTNGTFDKTAGQALIDHLGKDRNIYWITAYGQHLQWQDYSNEVIYALAEDNENVTIIDWAETAPGHSDWFYEDGIHLNADGQKAYADFIKECIS